MAATPWLMLLFLSLGAGGVLQARAQPDSNGFISIDCGTQGKEGYVDTATKLLYYPDTGFTDGAGISRNISADYITPSLCKCLYTVRSFASGVRNCYTLRSLLPGLKYLIRAKFMYGNYDSLRRPPIFDLHIGVNYWQTVNITKPDTEKSVEAIVMVPNDFLQVCLINTGAGTPFISLLELRPLKKTMYPQVTAAQGLVLSDRINFGRDRSVRYPDDPHDRIWTHLVEPTDISTTEKLAHLALSEERIAPIFQLGSINNSVDPHNETMMRYVSGNDVHRDNSSLHRLESRQFTYEELKMITNNFQRVLGQGGFGYVYDGFQEDGTHVAVKLQSHSSSQGVKEFLAEAHILTRIHHKNLVTMIGYCKDGKYMALVYEYMSEGTLHEHIEGSKRDGGCLSWSQRLRIALESAQGLEYLHKGCNPPIIHRDIKATNILLNVRLEAKIADFGLSKAFNGGDDYASTMTLVGTPGYVDPEYLATMQPTTKSDVYNFGVMLLELVTGKTAILVVDARMCGIYDVNSVWKMVEMALKCTAYVSPQRPTMTGVVAQLQECMELEEGSIYS
ncbi:probable LRR receptor-like serine/threonine-protein kinase At1g51880 [Triticum dicoccoides]|uniref:probable LRR receptor-like serine/threonine-protein kinase At1g51880 n=1 Tax=Triticum dicoccoides TaxID=85692 RepID=UPI00188E8E48|nr:probable LRR receptor-like serine/threonine-protein kinase At1g51880 [Triticum dicoccoides]